MIEQFRLRFLLLLPPLVAVWLAIQAIGTVNFLPGLCRRRRRRKEERGLILQIACCLSVFSLSFYHRRSMMTPASKSSMETKSVASPCPYARALQLLSNEMSAPLPPRKWHGIRYMVGIGSRRAICSPPGPAQVSDDGKFLSSSGGERFVLEPPTRVWFLATFDCNRGGDE